MNVDLQLDLKKEYLGINAREDSISSFQLEDGLEPVALMATVTDDADAVVSTNIQTTVQEADKIHSPTRSRKSKLSTASEKSSVKKMS